MMTYDPDERPEMDQEALKRALEYGMKPLAVQCHEGDGSDAVSFTTFASFVPRIGERIVIEDGGTFEVQRVYHKIVRQDELTSLMPNVFAIRCR